LPFHWSNRINRKAPKQIAAWIPKLVFVPCAFAHSTWKYEMMKPPVVLEKLIHAAISPLASGYESRQYADRATVVTMMPKTYIPQASEVIM